MMTSQIFKLADLWKTQKSKYFDNETYFFSVLKKIL